MQLFPRITVGQPSGGVLEQSIESIVPLRPIFWLTMFPLVQRLDEATEFRTQERPPAGYGRLLP